MGGALARHDSLIRSAVEDHAGFVFKTVGDAVCAAFQSSRDSLEAAIDSHAHNPRTAGSRTLRCGMGIHAGATEFRRGLLLAL